MDNGQDTTTPQIDYELLVEEALRAVVRSSLEIAEKDGMTGETHFYITFLTGEPGVDIPDRLRESHPDKMTIVLQHQFWDLKVESDKFSVTLTFGGIPETLAIPFSAVVDFNDPSVGFGLQFAQEEQEEQAEVGALPAAAGDKPADGGEASAEVVSLEKFRKKT